MGTQSADRRQNLRIATDFPVRITTFPSETLYEARLGDSSRTGLRLLVDEPLGDGELIGVTLDDDALGTHVELIGAVRWRAPGAMGLEYPRDEAVAPRAPRTPRRRDGEHRAHRRRRELTPSAARVSLARGR